MNANELADELENTYPFVGVMEVAATMLRQQQAEIGFYKQDADKYKLKCESQQAEIEALKEQSEDCTCQGGHSEAYLKAKGKLK